MKKLELKIKMVDNDLTKIGGDIPGEWYDLRASNVKKINGVDVAQNLLKGAGKLKYKKGDVILFGLGLAIQPPKDYEIILAARSGTFKNYGFILSNGIGVGDNSYTGEYMAMVYCTRDGVIEYNERFLQFRIQEQQPLANISFVDELDETERGSNGYGSSGVR